MSTSLLRTVSIERCHLTSARLGKDSIDLRPFLLKLDIFENVFSPTLSGTLYLKDDISLISRLPLTGAELIQVQFTVQDPAGGVESYGQTKQGSSVVVPLAFHVFKQTDRTFINPTGLQAYTLGLVSTEMTLSLQTRISKNYTDRAAEDVVQDILRSFIKTEKTLNVEKTQNKITLTFPYMSPLDVIKVLTSNARSATGQPNYVFFETLRDFKFMSLDSLIATGKQNNQRPIVVVGAVAGTEFPSTGRIVHPKETQMPNGFDVLEHISSGYFQSRTTAVDVLSGAYRSIDRRLETEFSKRQHLNAYLPYLKNFDEAFSTPQAKVFLVPTRDISFSKYGQTDSSLRPDNFDETIDARNRQIQELRQQRLTFIAPGQTGLAAGKVIDVVIPQKLLPGTDTGGSILPQSEYDKYRSGNYFVIGAKHSLINTSRGIEYETTVEASTDSFSTSLN